MGRCVVCGNDYARSFDIRLGDRTETFDSFECAIHRLAPRCAHCQCPVIGHGSEANGLVYCCAHCARESGIGQLQDHAR